MLNYYYKDSISDFCNKSIETIIGEITLNNQFDSSFNQNKAWEKQIEILKPIVSNFDGTIIFEFSIPRLGKRIDCVLIIGNIVFVIEFKVGEKEFLQHSLIQVWDYALDLKNFHQPSHDIIIVPILIATESNQSFNELNFSTHNDNLANPLKTNKKELKHLLASVINLLGNNEIIDSNEYASGSYKPTPTIIEAAISLYNSHRVDEITRNDSGAKNLSLTTSYISEVIEYAKSQNKKAICFVTGVPGAGKTLVGLKVATEHLDRSIGNSAVFLSGNGPLVAVLKEALVRDKVERDKDLGIRTTKAIAYNSVKAFIQIIHHYRDAYLVDKKAPDDHVAIFDEAQRAWHKEQTIAFMKAKKGQDNFDYSEPEFLISCLDRHPDWAVVVCLVGGGQEINTGEAGISEWLNAIQNKFSDWEVHISPELKDKEYNAYETIDDLKETCKVLFKKDLHLSVSMRSFRAENLSLFIKQVLDIDIQGAQNTLQQLHNQYPILLTRDLQKAKAWLKEKARGSERYGIVVSSQAQRLKPLAIDVRTPVDPVHWFLNERDDIRSSFFLEDVATEFQVQGLELDWACVTWDGDMRFSDTGWQSFSFVGSKWHNIRKDERKKYQLNAYRVLLTRARQGMIIVVPEGNPEDQTRLPEFYDETYSYFKKIGIKEI